MDRVCTVDGCDGIHLAKGYCGKHYLRIYKRGTLNLSKMMGIGKTPEERFLSRVEKSEGCWTWKGKPMKNGYGQITVNYKKIWAHRYSWSLANGRTPVLHILHSCDNPLCVNPAHLREGTPAENSNDAKMRDRIVKGEKVHTAKLNEKKVREIKQRISNGENENVIAANLHVSRTAIYHIRTKQTWAHVI